MIAMTDLDLLLLLPRSAYISSRGAKLALRLCSHETLLSMSTHSDAVDSAEWQIEEPHRNAIWTRKHA